ncbi:hypothetical protein RSAG8_06389, partial [Rhizoctonia solani AG-8 WAC10335]
MYPIPEIPEVTLDSLMDAILHAVPPDKLDSVYGSVYHSIRVLPSQMNAKDHSAQLQLLMCHIPEVPEVTLDSLMDAVLHAVPPDKLDSVCERLISNGAIQGSDRNPRWKCVPQHSRTAQPDELGFFKAVKKIILAVTNSHSNGWVSDVKFKISQESILLDSRHDSSCPDGFFYLGNRRRGSSNASWTNILMPVECNNADNEWDRIENHAKVIWSMHHVMCNDPRRRFVHGMTCENARARLWYSDRCDVVASEEFDINEDWRHLVRIVLSMLLAPPDRLGYDPDVELLPSDNPRAEPSYNITIRNSDTGVATTYRTIKIIFNDGTNRMVGPGVRVWIVRKLVDGDLVGPSYVLKDLWVQEDRVAEHVLLKEIRAAQPSYAQYFLTPLDHGSAYFSVAAPENTHKTLRRTELIPTNSVLLTHSNTTQENTHKTLRRTELIPTNSVLLTHSNTTHRKGRITLGAPRNNDRYPGDMPSSRPEGYRDVRYLSKHPLQHYRIVFKEVGTPVHDLRDWTDIFTAIQGGWEGLHAMNLCGYVHRDVSSGNIMLVPSFVSIMERWATALGGHYRSSYEQHDASNAHLKSIRIESNTMQASYKHGRAFLQQLVKASRSLSATFVSVQEQSNAGHSTITTQPLADSLPTTSTEHLAAGPSTKITKRPREILSPWTTEREKVSSTKATQPPKAGPTRKTIQRRTPGAPAESTKQQKDKPAMATTLRRLSVFVELPAPKKARTTF